MNKVDEIKELKDILLRMSDSELQYKGWFGKIPGKYICYFETIPHFNDLVPYLIKNWEDYPIDYSTVQKLKMLMSLVEDFDLKVYEDYEKKASEFNEILKLILKDPEWDKICQTAEDILKSIQ